MTVTKLKLRGPREWHLSCLLAAARVVTSIMLAWPVLTAHAMQDIHGRVVRVTDGDTIVVEDRDRRRHKVRLVGIDAPEKGRRGRAGQPYADRSRQHLAELVENGLVRLVTRELDDYGRILARVWVADVDEGNDVDVGLAQVCAGYAWVYEAFASTLATAQQAYRSCQLKAQAGRLGLWRKASPVPPWVWRHTRNSALSR